MQIKPMAIYFILFCSMSTLIVLNITGNRDTTNNPI